METIELIESALMTELSDAGRCALEDAIQEAGISPLAAKRRANKAARLAQLKADHIKVLGLITAGNSKAAKLRTMVRRAVGLESNKTAPVTVVEGDAAPVRTGEAAYTTFRKGGVCNYPGAAIRAGYKVDYHASTLAVTVGAGWVLRNMK